MARAKVVQARAAGRTGAQLREPGRRITKKQIATFLSEFAGSCNVQRSCEAAGMSTQAAYARRRRDPVFAKAWAEAMCEGYAKLELLMLERALGEMDEPLPEAGSKALRMSERSMLSMLSVHRQAVKDARAAMAPAASGDDDSAAILISRLEEIRERLLGPDDAR